METAGIDIAQVTGFDSARGNAEKSSVLDAI
jgi:hypothetical protein